jgi:hypothetical protein
MEEKRFAGRGGLSFFGFSHREGIFYLKEDEYVQEVIFFRGAGSFERVVVFARLSNGHG